MTFLILLLTAISISLDVFALSIVASATISKSKKFQKLYFLPFIFAFSHTFFTLTGWLAGIGLNKLISSLDHWIAFFLLIAVGIKMILESKIKTKSKIDFLKTQNILPISIATGIDTLAIGISFSFLKVNIWQAVLTIVFITILFSFSGLFLGNKFKNISSKKINILAGLILIGIGFKILIEHLA